MPTQARRVSNAEMREYDWIVQRVTGGFMRRIPTYCDRDDIEAAGRIGLFHALSRAPNRDEKFESYAFGRVRGGILDELRAQAWVGQKARARGDVAIRVPLDDDIPAPGASLEMAMLVRSALSTLKIDQARVLISHYVDDLDYQAIAQEMGRTPARISQIKRDGLDALAAIFDGPGREARVKPRPKRRKAADGSPSEVRLD